MKLKFEAPAMQWLHQMIQRLIVVANRSDEAETMGRVARKMRHKFHGNPPVVFLTSKERGLITNLVVFRMGAIATQPTTEHLVLKNILETLGSNNDAT